MTESAFILLIELVLDEICGAFHILALEELDDTLVTKGCKLGIDRKLCEYGSAVAFSKLFDMALAVRSDNLAAIGTYDIAVVLYKAENVYVHKRRHIYRLLNDHGYKLLGAGNDNDAVERKALEYGEGNVACAGRLF